LIYSEARIKRFLMNRVFIAVDGDDIGEKINESVLQNDVNALAEFSNRLNHGIEAIREWANSHQGAVVNSGGDEAVIYIDGVEEDELLDSVEHLREVYKQITGCSLSAGTGSSLVEAGKALLAGKVSGKDMVVPYGEEIEDLLRDAHQDHSEAEGADNFQSEHGKGGYDQEQSYDDSEDMSDDSHKQYLLHTADGDMGEEDSSEENSEDDSLAQQQEYQDDNSEDQSEDFDYNPEDFSDGDEQDYQDDSQDQYGSESDQESEENPENDFSMSAEDMQGAVDNVIESPEEEHGEEEGGQDHQDEEEIEIPDSDKLDSEDDETEELPMANDETNPEELPDYAEAQDYEGDESAPESEDDQEQSGAEAEALNQMMSDPGQKIVKMKKQVAATLSAFKDQKDQLVAIQQQAPELYEATLGMLQTMLDLSKALFGGPEDQQEQPEQEEASPNIEDHLGEEEESSPKY